MKTPIKTLALLTGAAFFSLSTLTAVTTDPVGYSTFNGASGNYLIGSPFLKAKTFQSEVASISGTSIVFSSGVPTLDAPSYIHVLSGNSVGRVSTILGSNVAGDGINIEDALDISANDLVAVRPHFTLADFGVLPNFTGVTIFQLDGAELNASFVFGSWDVSAQTVIFPGEGVLLNLPEAASIVFSGSVATEPVVVKLAPGTINLITGLRPVDNASSLAPSGLALLGGLPDFSAIAAYTPGTLDSPVEFSKFFGSWDGDLETINLSNYTAQLVNPTEETFVTLPGISL